MSPEVGVTTPRATAALPVFAAVLAVSLLCWPTMVVLFGKWAPISENVMSHAWLVVAIIAWGVWTEARWLTSPARTGSAAPLPWLPLLLTAVLSLMWALTLNAALLVPQQLLWLALLFATLWSAWGSEAMRALLRPLWILILLMPIWTLPHSFLWWASTTATKAMLSVLGVPAYFEGNTIHLVSGTIQIAAGCAGLAFFAAALAVAAIIGYLNRASLRQHLVLLLSAGVLAMICNWLRITIIVFEAHRTQMQTYLITTDHYVFGWVLFAIGLTGYCYVFGRYGLESDAPRHAVISALTPLRLLLACVCAALGPALVALRGLDAPLQAPAAATTTPAGFVFTTAAKVRWYPNFPASDSNEVLRQEGDAPRTFVYATVLLAQQNDRRLIGEGHSVLPNERWTALRSRRAGDHAEMLASDPGEAHWLIRYSYVAPHWATGDALRAQLQHGWDRFFGAAPLGVLAVAVACQQDCDAAEHAAVESAWSVARPWYASNFGLGRD